MKTYGYCRISTAKQSLERQVENISKHNADAEIITEVFTGTSVNRPAWTKLLKNLKAGDTVIFDSVSRMSRNADEGIAEYMELYNKGITLVFLKESYINTEVYRQTLSNNIQLVGNEIADIYINATNKVLQILAEKQIRIAFEQAEKEVKDLQQRTKEGMKASGAGKKISEKKTGTEYNIKKSAPSKDLIKKHYKKFGGSLKADEVMKLTGLARNTFFKYVKEIEEE